MSKPWHLRPGAPFPRARAPRQFFKPHCHVSFERRGIISTRERGTPPWRPEPSWEVRDAGDGPSKRTPITLMPTGRRLTTIPPTTSCVTPFDELKTRNTSSGPEKAHDQVTAYGGDGNLSMTGPRSLDLPSQGLGSWVIAHGVQKGETTGTNDVIDSSPERLQDKDGPTLPSYRYRRSQDQRQKSLLSFTLEYTTLLHDALGKKGREDTDVVLKRIKTIFYPSRMNKLKLRGHEPEDVVCWGWILAAETANLAVNRMHTISNIATRAAGNSPITDMPYFMFVTILRSHDLNASSLGLLVSMLLLRLPKEKPVDIHAYPDATTAMILLVRLVRHARRVAPSQLPTIADLAGTLLKVEFVFNPKSPMILQRLSHGYNRLLSLISIPTSKHPYSSTAVQQQAQFRVIRQMAATEPSVPVNREGYQALAKVQLAHQRTTQEREWARTKSDSWPPWKEDRLGISEDLEYPGSQSRAADVLRRQIEGGYSQTTWDKAANILAGWDTDKSPTIQTRSIVKKAPLNWFQSLVRSYVGDGDDNNLTSKEDPEVWAGRIRATRTVREAWSCFCSYETASKSDKHKQEPPYYAMLEKLAARVQQTDHANQLPGEGREVFPEPLSPRHHLYLHTEPPSFHSFYEKLRLDGIRPAGRLLSLLLDNARNQSEGIDYIETSKLSEITKDILLNAQKYEAGVIQSSCKYIQPFVIASFLNFLWRSRKDSSKVWYKPTSQAVADDLGHSRAIDTKPMNPRAYALAMMTITKPSVQVFNKVLSTATAELLVSRSSANSNDKWRPLSTIIRIMQEADHGTDMATFHTIGSSIEFLTAGDDLFIPTLQLVGERDAQSSRTYEINGCLLAKELFLQAIIGNTQHLRDHQLVSVDRIAAILRFKSSPGDNPTWLSISEKSKIIEFPSTASLHLLMRLLARGGEVGSIMCLVEWMGRFASEINKAKEGVANGERQLRFALCVAAMAMEDADTTQPGTAEYVKTVREVVDQNPAWGGWPTDVELERYLLSGRRSERRENRR